MSVSQWLLPCTSSSNESRDFQSATSQKPVSILLFPVRVSVQSRKGNSDEHKTRHCWTFPEVLSKMLDSKEEGAEGPSNYSTFGSLFMDYYI